jgi:hypothetical protein
MLKFGVDPQFIGFSGASEFRALEEFEVEELLELMAKHQVDLE